MSERADRTSRRGLLLVYTGDGKGKTTAALGLALRAAGRGMKVKILQFIKSPQRTYGEAIALARLGVEIRQLGVGFTWTRTPEEHREALRTGWQEAREALRDPSLDVLILDELNNALAISTFPVDDVLPLADVLDAVQHRPPHLHVVITGRKAKPELIALADLVTTMEATKHYYEEGIPAVKGLEF